MIKSSFFEYNVAVSGLFSAQANLKINAHNIANASTDGYSRQYGIQSANDPMGYYDGRGMYGTGSSVNGIGQYRNTYLDTKFWNRNTTLGEYTSKNTHMSTIESNFNELGDGTGVLGGLDNYFAALQQVSTNSSDLTIRNSFVTEADTFAKLINTLGSQLDKQQNEINDEIKMTVDRINSIGQQISSLNGQIERYEMNGDRANDLRDSRALLIDELSEYVDVNVTEEEMNKNYDPNDIMTGNSKKLFSVQINGQDYVKGTIHSALECVERKVGEEKNPNDVAGLYDIKYAGSGTMFNIYNDNLEGRLKGLVDVRDGNNNKHAISPNVYGETFAETTEYKGIPHLKDKLNNLIRVFSAAFNEGKDYNGNNIDGVTGHQNGYDLNGDIGNLLFTFTDSSGNTLNNVDTDGDGIIDTNLDYSKMNYNNFTVNTDMLSDPSLFAASTDPTSGESDNSLILELLSIQKDNEVFAEGSVEDFVNGMSIEVGISVNQAVKFEEMYTGTVALIENQRMEVSGVDLNDEMMLMIQYQQQYNASAKLVNAIDGIYNTLINSLGI